MTGAGRRGLSLPLTDALRRSLRRRAYSRWRTLSALRANGYSFRSLRYSLDSLSILARFPQRVKNYPGKSLLGQAFLCGRASVVSASACCDVLCKGWFHPLPHYIGWRLICGRMAEAGAPGDDLGAPFSLSALCEERTYSPPASWWWYGLRPSCALRGLAPPSAFPCQYIQQTPTAACASDAAAPITGGLGAFGHQQAAQGIYLRIACYYYQRL